MDDSVVFRWNVGQLPFIWKPLSTPANHPGLPDGLPFSLMVDSSTGRLCQAADAAVSDALHKAYSAGSEITGMMDEAGIGRRYAEDFLAFLDQQRGSPSYSSVRVLEIGCGNGYLLHRLKLSGAEVLGIEPGEHGASGATRFGVDIVCDYFPAPGVSGPFDLIILYCVLEHIENPVDLIAQLLPYLAPQGRVALAVPDCTPYIRQGDVSMLFHEHWSYFEQSTLRASLQQGGLGEATIQNAGFGGLLYAYSGKGAVSARQTRFTEQSHLDERGLNYFRLAKRALDRLRELLVEAENNKASLGIYVPSRAVNALSMISLGHTRIRFFDDNPALHGTYFPGIDIEVEPRSALLSEPTDMLLIFSHTFGEKLAAELATLLPATHIVTWKELFGDMGE